jgi:hypothetical protein
MLSPYNIAKTVIVSHTLVTVSVILLISQHFFGTSNNKELLYYILSYNTATIMLHMAYRVYERKLKQTFKSQSSVLILHIATSIGAIVNAFISTDKDLELSFYITTVALWVFSISSGWIIFYKKYSSQK